MEATPRKRRRTSKGGMLHACMRPGMLARGACVRAAAPGTPPQPLLRLRGPTIPRGGPTGRASVPETSSRQGWCRACERGTPPTSGQGPGGHAGLRGVALACSTAQWAGRELGCAQRREGRDNLAGGERRAEMAGSQKLTDPALPGPRVCSTARVTTAGSQRRAKRRHRSCVGGQGRCRPRARAQGKEGGWRCQTAAISLLILNALSSPHPIQRRGCRAGAVKGWRAAGSSPTSRLPALRVLCSQ